MANTYYHRVFNPLPGQRVDEQVLKDEFQRIELGFDGVATKAGQTDAGLATKANLAGGNALTGDQSIAGNLAIAGHLAVGGTVSAATPLPPADNSQALASTNWVRAWVSSQAGGALGLPVAPVQARPLALFVIQGVQQWAPVQSRSKVFFLSGA
ncbi:hypothetical protein HNP48_004921 [Acidovorax soli]|uniref:Uncharacterized protein n=1 Tax=Acidovorax soli TaxID=592050 RepID=A0A7X0PHR8_9BURK|nr:hypothetical protein [Acidovorax soli]MBB6562212.1 hypothetical protein [Acidovorax soli]